MLGVEELTDHPSKFIGASYNMLTINYRLWHFKNDAYKLSGMTLLGVRRAKAAFSSG